MRLHNTIFRPNISTIFLLYIKQGARRFRAHILNSIKIWMVSLAKAPKLCYDKHKKRN